MARSPKHVTAVMTLLIGFACVPAGAAQVDILAPAQQDTIHDTLQGVERGEHRLQALLIDRQGQSLSVSDTVQFTMWQASKNSPARKKKTHVHSLQNGSAAADGNDGSAGLRRGLPGHDPGWVAFSTTGLRRRTLMAP